VRQEVTDDACTFSTELVTPPPPAGETVTRAVRPLAALVVIAVISAGCSNGSAGNGTSATASAGAIRNTSTAGSFTGASHSRSATLPENAVKYAACMRRNGVDEFPSPTSSGGFPAFAVTANPAVWDRALAACEALKPPGSFSARLSVRQQSRRLGFARCVRKNGVRDFPDPASDAPLVDMKRIRSAATPAGMRALNAAILKCEGFVGG
jgi:hypothetical protein